MKKAFLILIVAIYLTLCIEPTKVLSQGKNYYYLTWLEEKYGIHYYMTNEEFKLLCHTVYCEAGNQPEEAQRLVAIVILNRVGSKKFPSTIRDVIYQGDGSQFNVVRWNGFPDAYPYSDTTELAVFNAIAQYPFEPTTLLAFRSGYHFNWGTPYPHKDEHGAMYFSMIE